jgi:hypothetical protein
MNTGTLKAKDIAKRNARPLWVFHATVGTRIVARDCLDDGLVGIGHLHHDDDGPELRAGDRLVA